MDKGPPEHTKPYELELDRLVREYGIEAVQEGPLSYEQFERIKWAKMVVVSYKSRPPNDWAAWAAENKAEAEILAYAEVLCLT